MGLAVWFSFKKLGYSAELVARGDNATTLTCPPGSGGGNFPRARQHKVMDSVIFN